ncbi:LuxR C-terminal-related transcriptional regulator [Limnoglobus roseus]|uniref:LuxR C-terminal-related transcriptional regulator n=1 Tax=Limnoglobus roseus TaxID=2598579 RepID=UPI00143D7F70|nr:response regulator transcription factor [Limnoglobus roseus]
MAIVDGQPVFRLGFRALIANEPDLHLIAEATNLGQAQQLLAATPFDVLVLEMDLPDGNGLDLLAAGAGTPRPPRALVLTGLNEDPFALAAVEAGALGFVGKHEPAEVIIAAIRQVLSHRTHLPSRILARLLRQHTGPDPDLRGIGQLSTREKEVFSLLGEGLTAKEIARRLAMSVHTVDTHRERMKRKLKVSNGAALTRQAVEWRLRYDLARQADFNRNERPSQV